MRPSGAVEAPRKEINSATLIIAYEGTTHSTTRLTALRLSMIGRYLNRGDTVAI